MSFESYVNARAAATTLANNAHSATRGELTPGEATKLERTILNELERLDRIEGKARLLVTNMPDHIVRDLRELIG